MKIHHVVTLTLALGFVTSAATTSHAAPFCVQLQGIPLQCLYNDPAQCQAEALRQGGRCATNTAEYKTPTNGAAFCVVQSGNVAECLYPDFTSCNNRAQQVHGACVAATPSTPPQGVDPYELKRLY